MRGRGERREKGEGGGLIRLSYQNFIQYFIDENEVEPDCFLIQHATVIFAEPSNSAGKGGVVAAIKPEYV